MEKETGTYVDMHAVKRVAEVRASAANDLLDAGWILHDIYFSSDSDYHSNYVMLALDEPACPSCGARAKVEILDSGHRVRFVCTDECSFTPIDLAPIPEDLAERSSLE